MYISYVYLIMQDKRDKLNVEFLHFYLCVLSIHKYVAELENDVASGPHGDLLHVNMDHDRRKWETRVS